MRPALFAGECCREVRLPSGGGPSFCGGTSACPLAGLHALTTQVTSQFQQGLEGGLVVLQIRKAQVWLAGRQLFHCVHARRHCQHPGTDGPGTADIERRVAYDHHLGGIEGLPKTVAHFAPGFAGYLVTVEMVIPKATKTEVPVNAKEPQLDGSPPGGYCR